MMIWLTAEQLAKLPTDVVKLEPGPAIVDGAAHAKLLGLLSNAIGRLQDLRNDPIVIAASPYRFNDIFWSDWRAVRVGGFFSERHDYDDRDYEKDLREGPDDARQAASVLAGLEREQWRDLFVDAFGLSWNDQILAVVLEDQVPWLAFSASNNTEENHVFSLWGSPLSYFGECAERLDWEMQEARVLVFQRHGS